MDKNENTPEKDLKRDPFSKPSKDGYYSDDDVRAVVGRLLNDDVRIDSESDSLFSKDISKVKKTPFKESYDIEGIKSADDEYLEYIESMSDENKKIATRIRMSKERTERRRAEVNAVEDELEIDDDNIAQDVSSGGILSFLSGDVRNILIATLFVFLIILFFLVLRNLSVTEKLKVANEKIETMEDDSIKYANLMIDYDNMKSEKDQLQADNNALLNQIDALAASGTNNQEHEDNNTDSNEIDNLSTPTDQPTDTVQSGPTKYTVVKGDSLWTIAKKHYNNGGKYLDIMAANNITNENDIKVGQELILP